MTPVGLARARQLLRRQELSPQTIDRMLSYFARHEVDKQGSSWESYGKGRQAWEEHPRQASAVATHRGETAGAAVLPFFPSPIVMAHTPPHWLLLVKLRFWPQTGMQNSPQGRRTMCLSPEDYETYSQLARNLADEKLLALDAHYHQNTTNTWDMQLHSIVQLEICSRREFRQKQLEHCLWLSTRRGRFQEAIKRWLIRRGIWSSAMPKIPLPLIVLWRVLRLFLMRNPRAETSSIHGRRASA
jgi:hypothetical protein